MAGKKKQKKKPRKLAEKGLEAFMDWLKKQKPKDLAELALMGGLAYAGYERWHHWKGAIIGPVSLKLALAPGGTWHVSQVAGLAGLVNIGCALDVNIPGLLEGSILDAMAMPAEVIAEKLGYKVKIDQKIVGVFDSCPEGMEQVYGMWPFFKVCARIREKP